MAPTILCVEDEADLRSDICEELVSAGYDVREAGDGREALAEIERSRPDLVLCDITMPRLSGLDLLAETRRRPGLGDLPFVFLTALASRSDIIAGKAAGVDDYLTKPIDFDLMLITIAARLDQVARIRQAFVEPEPSGAPSSLGALLLSGANEALDRVAVGIFLVNSAHHVVYSNRQARDLLGAADGLSLSREGLLRGERPLQTNALSDAIDRALANATAGTRAYGSPVALTRSSGRRPLFAVACPLRRGPVSPDEPVVGLFVTDPERRSSATVEAVAELYRLSPAETRVAVALCQGLRLEEIAEEFGLSRNTVSYTVKNLFRKTETDRQADLISLFIGTPLSLEE